MGKGHFLSKFHLLILFGAILVLPVLNQSTGIWEFDRKDENRNFKDRLVISLNNITAFPKESEEYINDNFSFRRPLLDLYHYIKFFYFKVSPHPEKSIIGQDGWFFMAEKEKDIFEGKLNFSDEDLEKFVTEWKTREHYLDSLNIKFHWVICPFKQNIYPEYLPFNESKGNNIKRANQLIDYMQDEFPDLIIDPTDKLLEEKKTKKVYYKLDNHWNFYAGYLTSQLIVSRIKKDFPEIEIQDIPEYTWYDTLLRQGIHYKVMGLEELYEMDIYPDQSKEQSIESEKYRFPIPIGFSMAWNYERRYINKNSKSGLRVLFIRDSFGNQLVPFVKEPFAESLFIFDAWRYELNKPIIEKVKPDVVIFIGLETHLESFIKYTTK